ncbi:MAG: hypothetical protein AAGG56_06035 [Pseudomonadota bacterium]
MSHATEQRNTGLDAAVGGRSPAQLGISEKLRGFGRPFVWGGVATLSWIALVGGFGGAHVSGFGTGDVSASASAEAANLALWATLVLPIGLIWLTTGLASTLREQRLVTSRLSRQVPELISEIEAVRRTVSVPQSATPDTAQRVLQSILETSRRQEAETSAALARLESDQAKLQATLSALLEALAGDDGPTATTASAPGAQTSGKPTDPNPEVKRRSKQNAEEPPLPHLGAPESETATRPNWQDLVRALDFPRDDQDFDGFRALQAVLRYHPLAQMLQSAEDVLTLLSQEGVYMEDLAVLSSDPAAWRAFMAGTRGAEVASVGGILDEHALEQTRALLKTDPIFRDTALFFQRRFDRVLQDFASAAADDEIIEMANTRSGRAFMLLARLNGAFD